jgi:hypothetical protein
MTNVSSMVRKTSRKAPDASNADSDEGRKLTTECESRKISAEIWRKERENCYVREVYELVSLPTAVESATYHQNANNAYQKTNSTSSHRQ